MEIERIVKMERFDYPSVMAILMEHMPREAYGSQVALLELLYAGYVEDTGHVFDNGQVNKWLKGKERFSPKVSTYYMEQKHRYDLCAANLHSNLGGLYHQVGRIDLAKLHMEQGWFLLREYDLLHYHDSITQVVNYAMLLSETKEFDRGIEALNKVDAYLREGALEDTLDYAWVQESLALLHMMAGHMQTGLDHYRKCIAIWKHIFADEPERVAEKQAQIQRNCLKAGVYLARRLSEEL